MYLSDENAHLSAGITIEQIIESFTTPGKQFEFPIKSIPVGLDKESRDTLLIGAALIGLAAIGVAAIIRK
jgi:hypothetical protein